MTRIFGDFRIFAYFTLALALSLTAVIAEDSEPQEADEGSSKAMEYAAELAEKFLYRSEVTEPNKAPEILIYDGFGRGVQSVFSSEVAVLRRHMSQMVNELSSEGDSARYYLDYKAFPLPWAALGDLRVIRKGKEGKKDFFEGRIELALGAFGFIQNKDELAALLALRMAEANPREAGEQSSSEVDRYIDEFLRAFETHQSIDGAHERKIRADLGALERLIRAGYNPSAAVAINERIAGWVVSSSANTLKRTMLRLVFGKVWLDLQAQPLQEVRISAMKTYLRIRGRSVVKSDKEKFYNLMHKTTPLPPEIERIGMRARLLNWSFQGRNLRWALPSATLTAALVGWIIHSGILTGPEAAAAARWSKEYAVLGTHFFLSHWLKVIGIPLAAVLAFGASKAAYDKIKDIRLKRAAAATQPKVSWLQKAKKFGEAALWVGKLLGKASYFVGKLAWDVVSGSILKFIGMLRAIARGVIAAPRWTLNFAKKVGSVSSDLFDALREALKSLRESLPEIPSVLRKAYEQSELVFNLKRLGDRMRTLYEIRWKFKADGRSSVERQMEKIWSVLSESLDSKNFQKGRRGWLEYLLAKRHIMLSLSALKNLLEPLSMNERKQIFGSLAHLLYDSENILLSDKNVRAEILSLWRFCGGETNQRDFLDELFVQNRAYVPNPYFVEWILPPTKSYQNHTPAARNESVKVKNLSSEQNVQQFEHMRPLFTALDAQERFDSLTPWKKLRVIERLQNGYAKGLKKYFRRAEPFIFSNVFAKVDSDRSWLSTEVELLTEDAKARMARSESDDRRLASRSSEESGEILRLAKLKELTSLGAVLSRQNRVFELVYEERGILEILRLASPPPSLGTRLCESCQKNRRSFCTNRILGIQPRD